jgi:zinc and cadmium transporter
MQELPILGYILLFTFIGSVLSILGGVFLLFYRRVTEKISHLLISFAAGTLLGTAFFDLLPESLGEAPSSQEVFAYTLAGFLFFFILERAIHWAHHHHHNEHEHHKDEKPTVALITFGDSVHNFIDGVAIAATFLVGIPLGIITSFAVGAHEIPQEIGDFAIMLKRGLKPKKVLLFNFFSALTAMAGAILTFFLGEIIHSVTYIFIAITAGFFIYISASDLIPEIHEKNRRSFAVIETGMLFLGVITIYVLISILEH